MRTQCATATTFDHLFDFSWPFLFSLIPSPAGSVGSDRLPCREMLTRAVVCIFRERAQEAQQTMLCKDELIFKDLIFLCFSDSDILSRSLLQSLYHDTIVLLPATALGTAVRGLCERPGQPRRQQQPSCAGLLAR